MEQSPKSPVWEPRAISATNPAKFIDYVNTKHHLSLTSYQDLHDWSVNEVSFQEFWEDAYQWLQLGPRNAPEPGPMFGKEVSLSKMFPPPSFFPDATLNIAEIIFRDRIDDNIAIHFAREGSADIENITWKSLRERVRQMRSAMVNTGVGAGDVVCAIISNSVHAIVCALASLSIGAIWSSVSCDLGPTAILDRYLQVKPKIVFADDGYIYAGKSIKLQNSINDWSRRIQEGTASHMEIVIIPYCNFNINLSTIPNGVSLQDFLDRDSGDKLAYSFLGFSHPAFILYSSGTTGNPKCIVHSTGGVALKVKVDMTLQHDVRRTDVVFQYTTTSWVMWVLNFVNLSCAGAMLLYDGSPFHPRPTILLELAERFRVSVFGTSPKYLSQLKALELSPRKLYNLDKLRVVLSTGSTLSADLYHWFYTNAFPQSTLLVSMSGGTDIAGCFVGGTPMLPVYAGEIQCKALGMAVEVFDTESAGPAAVEGTGASGELVCTKPFPSQPLQFLGQDGAGKYEASYFKTFGPNVWCQGDFIKLLADTGGIVMLGRSDGVLNPSGVRFGSAEIYAVTDTIPEIEDCICVGQRRSSDEDERVLLFVKMRAGDKFTSDLEHRIRAAIRHHCSPRHVPHMMFEVTDIPYTVNGKKCETNVKNIICCRKAAASATVANPDALKLYTKFQTLPVVGGPSRGVSKL